jgi:hypothetical protein
MRVTPAETKSASMNENKIVRFWERIPSLGRNSKMRTKKKMKRPVAKA